MTVAITAGLAMVLLARTVNAAEITSVEPEMIDPNGGTEVTLTGSGFWPMKNKSIIKVGGLRITDAMATVWSDTELRFIMPKVSARTSPLQISIRDSLTKELSKDGWLYLLPKVTAMVTSSRAYPDMATAGSTVTITGQNFTTKPGEVLFDDDPGTIISWVPTKIVAKVSDGAYEGQVAIHVYSLNTEATTVEAEAPMSLYILPGVANDPLASENQWYISKMDGHIGWGQSTGNTKTIVAVISDGVDTDHYNLTQNIWRNKKEKANNGIDDDKNGYIDDIHGWNFSTKDNSPVTYGPLGTAAAGIIAARGNNHAGMAGISWWSKIMSLTVRPGKDSFAQYASAIRYATDNGSKVIYLGVTDAKRTGAYSLQFNQAIEYAFRRGVVIVVAAGDADAVGTGQPVNLNNTPLSPVCNDVGHNMVLGVGATDRGDRKASFSPYGSNCIDVMAPGTNILSTMPYSLEKSRQKNYDLATSGYGVFSGTGMAAAMVAAEAALLQDQFPEANNVQIIDLIKQSADDIDEANPFYLGLLGTGRINIDSALTSEPDETLATGEVKGVTTTHPVISSVPTAKGAAMIKVGKKTVAVRPLGKKYLGGVFAKKINYGGGKIVYLITPTSAGANKIMLYNAKGQFMVSVKPFAKAAAGLNVAVVSQFTDYVDLAVGQKKGSGTVQVYRVLSRGFTNNHQLPVARKNLKVGAVVKFMPLYPHNEFGLVTMADTSAKTLKVWRYSLTERKYVVDGKFDRGTLAVDGQKITLK